MAKVYDITSKLTNEKPVIKIDEGHQYEVDTTKNTALKLQLAYKDETLNDIEKLDRVVELALGKDALKYLNSLNLPLAAYTTVTTAIMAATNEMSMEEAEAEVAKQQKSFRE
jgi:hypothetical protein